MNQNSKSRKLLLTKMWTARYGYLMLLPLFTALFLFGYYPPINGIVHSFFEWMPGREAVFVGLSNYAELFTDKVFYRSIPPMLIFTFAGIVIALIIPFLIAEAIFAVSSSRAKYVYRTLLLVPLVVPGVVNILLWKFIYDPTQGLLNRLLEAMRLIPENYLVDMLGDPSLARWGVILYGFPWINGINVLIYLAGLMNIPTTVLDSAKLDGAIGLRRFLYIDIPYLLGQIRYFIVTGIIFWLQNYNLQLLLTRGGPGDMTNVPAYYMFISAFDYGRFGYGAAIGTVLFMVILGLSLVSLKFTKNQMDV